MQTRFEGLQDGLTLSGQEWPHVTRQLLAITWPEIEPHLAFGGVTEHVSDLSLCDVRTGRPGIMVWPSFES